MRHLVAVAALTMSACGSSQPSEEASNNQSTATMQRSRNIQAPRRSLPQSVLSDTSGVTSSSKSMPFRECLATIEQVSTDLGVTPINVIETTTVRMVRFNTADGSVLVTCSEPDEKMVITRSPHQG
jgi:hypothetical protein